MAYNQFTLLQVQTQFGLTVNTVFGLFRGATPYPVSAHIRDRLPILTALATTNNTEAARANFLISPLLGELWRLADYRIALLVGTRFDVDESAGLTGVCDFMIGRPPQLHYVTAPLVMIVEAKNDDIPAGLGQCSAAMVAAQRFNRGRNSDIATIHGAVTDGERWKFLRLREVDLDIDMTEYLVSDPDRILGILLDIVGVTPAAPAAA
jgi:hypothetical protein